MELVLTIDFFTFESKDLKNWLEIAINKNN